MPSFLKFVIAFAAVASLGFVAGLLTHVVTNSEVAAWVAFVIFLLAGCASVRVAD